MYKTAAFALLLVCSAGVLLAQPKDTSNNFSTSIHRLVDISRERVQRWESYLQEDSFYDKKKSSIQIPKDEFVLFTLFRNNIAVSDDAIEFVYSFNPNLSKQLA